MYQFIKGLSARHEIWCLSFSPSPQASAAAAPLADYCKLMLIHAPRRTLLRRAVQTLTSPLPDMALRACSSAFDDALNRLLARMSFDVVQAESIEMAQHAIQARGRVPLAILDQFNAEYVLQRRAALTDLRQVRRLHAGLYSLAQWQKLARYETQVCSSVDRVVVVSAEDRRALMQLSPAIDAAVVPNGVDTDFFAPGNQDPQGDCLLFTGTMDFRPNIDAVRWFVEEVLPLVRRRRPAYLRVVGRNPAAAVRSLARPGIVEVVGEVEDVRDSFRQAAVYVVPMRIGGGVRLKLLEAFSMALPVVSTSMGAEGVEGLRDSEHCLLADTPAAFAGAIIQLLEDRELARRLGAAARELACSRYDWRAIVPKLEMIYAG